MENANVVLRMAENDGLALVEEILAVSLAGRAPKQDPGLFALAIASVKGDEATRKAAYAAIPAVCRTASTLFTFIKYREQFGGWSAGLRRAVARWYTERDVDQLAYQMVKYRNRAGWTHQDVLRQAHIGNQHESARLAQSDPRRALLSWAARGETAALNGAAGTRIVEGFIKANEPGANVAALVADYGLPWEALPDEALGRTDVWNALLDKGMPLGALVRQLPRLTRLGLLPQMGGRTADVVNQITNGERLRASRIHPFSILVAHKTYALGHSIRGTSSWTPTRQIVDALDSAFYSSYGNVQPTGKRTLLALDVSGSMSCPVSGDIPISCREASAAIALITVNVEPNVAVVGYSTGLRELDISPRQRLGDAVAKIANLPFQGTDCSLPFREALRNKWELDTVVSYTDSETYAGGEHVHQSLAKYRQALGSPVKSIVVGLASNGFTVNDPKDPHGLDVAGLDSSVPQFISDFSAGV
jgi:60 kDa SS-A/Ro ribonucleoprotein